MNGKSIFFFFLISIQCSFFFIAGAQTETIDGLAGHWNFDEGNLRDLSGNGSDIVLNGTKIYNLGEGHDCLMLMPETGPVKIPVPDGSPLAISRGTISFWLNVGWTRSNFLLYNNGAIELNIYRGNLQVRLKGEDSFKYGSGLLDYNWPDYDMREWAFYGHPRASVHDSRWHHFAIAYDDEGKRIIGWRDGQLISVIDLSEVEAEPLKKKGLTEIIIGEDFAGFIDDIRIYNKVLTDSMIRVLYSSSASIYSGRFDTNPYEGEQEIYQYKEGDQRLYRAWLQYRPVKKDHNIDLFNSIFAEGDNSTILTAAKELKQAVGSILGQTAEIRTSEQEENHTTFSEYGVIMGTPETSPWINKYSDELGIHRIQNDGYILKTMNMDDRELLVIAGNVPSGVTFGTFDLIRRLQKNGEVGKLDILENPKIPIRMINHWSFFRGFPGDKWRNGSRDKSIYSWTELARGDVQLIRDWARMMASAGWNAICPGEINWDYRDNFLEHLDEAEILADILRDYGIKLFWSPSYLIALDPASADSLYARIPDFGGYMMKMGSEKQNGDPRPQMVNRIADNLRPYNGICLIRAFVYGNYRYTTEPYRHLIPYDIFTPEDGNYRENVILVPKGSAGDWDLSAPIPGIDGAMEKTLMGAELVIDKNFPSSWVEKWKWWLDQDTYRHGPGSLNKFSVHCIMGVSMISPSPAWTSSPLNMVNYYGLGRLAWNPDLSLDEIYSEWISQTFGNNSHVIETISNMLYISDDVARKLYMYRGYRGVWLDPGDKSLVENKTPYAINSSGIGPSSDILQKRLLDQYAPGLREIYGDPIRGEEFLSAFHFLPHDYPLTIGRTLIQDVYGNLEEAVQLSQTMVSLWDLLDEELDSLQFSAVQTALDEFVKEAKQIRDEMGRSFEKHTGQKKAKALSELLPEEQMKSGTYNVRHFGAKGDGITNDAPSINAAIDKAAGAGGGTVFLPSGIYASGSIHMKSNITLVLDAGAILKAMPDIMDHWENNPYDEGLMDPAYYHWEASLIWGKNLENVRILGPGALDGSALTRSSKVEKGTGDKAIALKLCKNIEIRNLNIRKGGHYAILATGCMDMLIDNVDIKTDRDGINLSQCSNVVISNCHVDAVRYENGKPAGGDDAIKLGSDLSLGEALESKNITIKNCYLASGCNGLQFGSETIAPFRNIRFENIRILRAGKAGISITSNDGSIIEDIHYKNIRMEKTFEPIFLKISDVSRVPEGTYQRGSIKNITFENITASDCYSDIKQRETTPVIWGKPGTPIENISFKNVSIKVKGGHHVSDAEIEPQENNERFPRHLGTLPASSWYIRHVKNILFQNCEFSFEQADGRPAFILDDASGITFEHTLISRSSESSSLISVRGKSENLVIKDCKGLADRSIQSVSSMEF